MPDYKNDPDVVAVLTMSEEEHALNGPAMYSTFSAGYGTYEVIARDYPVPGMVNVLLGRAPEVEDSIKTPPPPVCDDVTLNVGGYLVEMYYAPTDDEWYAEVSFLGEEGAVKVAVEYPDRQSLISRIDAALVLGCVESGHPPTTYDADFPVPRHNYWFGLDSCDLGDGCPDCEMAGGCMADFDGDMF